MFVFLIHTFCFLRSVCRIVCVSVDISLNIRGYFITYPWIFHYASAVTRVFCFVLVIYWLYVFGFSHIGGWFCYYPLRSVASLSPLPIGSSVAQGTVLPSLGAACHLGNPLKASLRPLKGRQCFLVSFVLRDSALSLFKGDEPEGRVGVTLIVAILFS